MLVYSDKLSPLAVELYHKREEAQERIRSRDGYVELREDIKQNGVLDPILCIQFDDHIQIEIGEQRLLIARELDIPFLSGFVRTDRWAIQLKNYTEIKDLREVSDHFRNQQVETFMRIRKYVFGGVIKL